MQTTDDSIDQIFNKVENLLQLGKINEIEDYLSGLDLHVMDLNLLIAALVITLPAKNLLPSRKRIIMMVERLEPERSKRLLENLI